MRNNGLLWLPNTGASRVVKFGPWKIFGEEGTVAWINEETGQYFQVEPMRAIGIAKDLAKNVLTKTIENGIAKDRQQYVEWETALQRIEEIAKEQLEKFGDSVKQARKLFI